MGESTSKLRDIWNGLEPKGQLTLVGSLVGVAVVFFLLFTYASKPSYSTLYTGLQPSDTASITAALTGAGIPWKVSSGGTEVDVQSGQEAAAQVALASKGLPTSGHVGFEIFDKTSLGTTEFQQQVDYQRALEGELDRALMQIQGVTNADVQLVIPQDSLFATQSSSTATASGLLTTSEPLDAGTVSGIAHLIAGAVKGLSPNNVTLTDQTGALLWPDSSGGMSTAAATLDADQQYATQLSSEINAMLDQTLGPGKAEARVHADLNVDQTTLNKIVYGKSVAAATNTSQESLKSTGGNAALPAGTSSNVPGMTNTTTNPGSTSNYNHKTDQTTYGLDRTTVHTVVAPGTVNQLDVALLVDNSVPAAQANALKASVAAMAGLVPKRGDTITLTRLAFAKAPVVTTPKTNPLLAKIGLAKYALAGLGALIFLLMMRRGLKRREGESVAEPVWLREIERSTPIAELEAAPVRAGLEPAVERRNAMRNQIEEIVRSEPEQIAAQVGQWLKD